MRLVRYEAGGEAPAFGWLDEGQVYRLDGDPLHGGARGEPVGPLDAVRLLAPCLPRKVIAAALNYPGIEGWSPAMSEPVVFIKPGTSVCDPGSPVVNPFPDRRWWGEAELAVVLRKPLRDVNEAGARDGVLGLTIANDTTVENVEGRDLHLARSKCADSFCPLGPWIDTDYDGSDRLIEAVHNGDVVRRGRTSDLVWNWPRIVSWLSTWITLEPWDVVLTGTPPWTTGPRYIEHGDVYTARIEGLGELTNRCFVRGAGR